MFRQYTVFFENFKIYAKLCRGKNEIAVVAQLVEHVIGNDEVSGSSPDNGSIRLAFARSWQASELSAKVAQLVEQPLRKG